MATSGMGWGTVNESADGRELAQTAVGTRAGRSAPTQWQRRRTTRRSPIRWAWLDALFREVQTRGLIVRLEGLQAFSGFGADDLVGTVGDDLSLAHSATSGNYLVHVPTIEGVVGAGTGVGMGCDVERRML